jgi:hypothetical protein
MQELSQSPALGLTIEPAFGRNLLSKARDNCRFKSRAGKVRAMQGCFSSNISGRARGTRYDVAI